ncbi:FAD/NAD(P)-binding protein [Streptantibioticus ferralitis]|uniref:FAD/NAD(P)-binding protein n=1 Tax=Streptantibioticus ferralitis TaxID=236510 RepID=A0ABT5ZBN8_9ACTN|nr:FAD/NAD(P)-binding protein [Streptantibioticus ferralitis]MDF2260445.1 FAD/NAD(P)-binding protein [Streptantibioticus ferralitis]
MTTADLDICIIGAGPRGLSVLERLCANARHTPTGAVTVHLVDPHPPGAGGVWRPDQSRHLLMNTVASQVTVFTDSSVEIDGPLEPGPSLYEWARFLSLMDTADAYDDETLAEARDLGPNTYPTRGFYGRYLEWVFRRVVRRAPEQLTVVVHRTRALGLDGPHHAGQSVVLEDGTRLDGLDAVVLAQGHVPLAPTAEEERFAVFAADHRLVYVPPVNPADVDLSAVPPGETVLLRGLGLTFFDHIALFTVGRGGAFERRDGRLVYLPSGREPKLHAGSRRGIPHHARGENEKGAHGRHTPLVLHPKKVAELRGRSAGGLDFRDDLWPLIAKEVETVYYSALLASRGCGCEARRFRERYLPHPWGDAQEAEVLRAFGIAASDRWEWERVAIPYRGQEFADPADFRSWLLDHLRQDVSRAYAGNLSGPHKSALDVLRDLRNEIRLLVDHGGLHGSSHRDDLDGWYTPLNAFLSIGPPAQRVEHLIALVEAGVVDILGPGAAVTTDPHTGRFAASSPAVPGSHIHAAVLIDARLPEADLRRTTDPLLRHLHTTGQCRPYRIAGRDGCSYATGGLAVTDRPYQVIDAGGRPHPRRFAFGVPTEAVHWVTAAGVRPGVNSVTLADSDGIARAVLALAPTPGTVSDRPVDLSQVLR